MHAVQNTTPHLTTLFDAARSYLSLGWPVIPLFGKLPCVPWKAFQSRRPTPAEVETWFRHLSPTGIGIVTGELSGLVVVDCDRAEDARFWQKKFPPSPLVVESGGGGMHVYYGYPPDTEVRNRVGVLKRKIDIRGAGGYATAPPSLHPSGNRYAFTAAHWEVKLPVFQREWMETKNRVRKPLSLPDASGVKQAVAYISKIHAVAGEGGHNKTFRVACTLRDAGLAAEEAQAILSQWNETNAQPPWTVQELRHKIRSAYACGRR